MIYDDLNYQHEADIFANQMRFVKPLNPYEIFVANIEAGSDSQLMIQDLVNSYGLTIGQTRNVGTICAVSTLESIYEKYGYHTLDHVLKLCIGTWEGEAYSFSSNMLNALAKLIVVYGDSLSDELFKEKLGAISVKFLLRTAKERRAGSLGLAEAMVLEYNGKKKNNLYRLQIRKLYEKQPKYIPDSNLLTNEEPGYNQVEMEELEPKEED